MTELSENAELIVSKRYAFNEKEDWQDLSIRCGTEVAKAENGQADKWAEKFSEIIYNLEFLPGGRILRNCGRLKGSLLNCFVVPIGDSIGDIGEFVKKCMIVWSKGGGIGSNISVIRPQGSKIMGAGGEASGPISFLSVADAGAKTIEIGGQRRAAGMAIEHVRHPGILEFIDAKNINKILSYFNLSVAVDENFIESVEGNKEWDLMFNHQVYDTIDARKIWDKIMSNMVKYAEPGLINWTNLRSNNSYYFAPIISTNPCGEVPLEKYGNCCLGSIVLTKFITGNVNTNWQKMAEVLRVAVRFLDNILNIEKYILPEFDKTAHAGRRIGIGIMGFAEYLFAKKIRYGSEKSVHEAEKLMKFIRDTVYEESIKIATEKGSFPKYDPIEYGRAHFVRSLPASTRMDIKKHGIRNVTLMAIAPTGTISLIPEVSPSIEPLMAKAYKTNDNCGERYYVNSQFKELIESGVKHTEFPNWFVDSFDLEPKNHLDIQVAIQKFVDGAVSKTINMPKGTTEEDLSHLLLEYIHDVKGVTVYVDGSRENQPINKVDVEEAVEGILKDNYTTTLSEDMVQCSRGNCEI